LEFEITCDTAIGVFLKVFFFDWFVHRSFCGRVCSISECGWCFLAAAKKADFLIYSCTQNRRYWCWIYRS